jgi:type VI secretion system protein ImpE
VSTVEEQLRAQVRAGDLSGCLAELSQEVRRSPGDARWRVFMAQLLMVTGDYDRAVTQLKVLGELDASALPMVRTYESAIHCERLRESVLRGERTPLVLGKPEPWMALLVQALAAQGAGRTAEADVLRVQAFEMAPASAGTLNGVEFEWIADADSRFGPILEVLLNGAYYWVPLRRIATMVVEPPADLRDLVWLPAQLTWINGGQAMALVPTRYGGTESAADTALKLARKTEWMPIGVDAFAGSGQRMLATDTEEVPLLAVRELAIRSDVGA